MKKYFGLMALWALVIAGLVAVSQAANTCNKTDFWCFESGPSQNTTTQGRLDSGGNLILNGNVTAVNTTLSGNQTLAGTTIFTPQSVVSVGTMTTITPTATYIQLVSSGSTVNFGLTVPAIATATATSGQYVILGSTSSISITITTGSVAGVISIATNTILINNVRRPAFIFDSANQVWVQTTAPAQL